MKTQHHARRSSGKRDIFVSFLAGLVVLGLAVIARMAQAKVPESPEPKKKLSSTPAEDKTPSPSDKAAPPPQEKLPEQKLGDTPVAPWDMPTPAEKAKVQPARRALEQAVAQVDTPQKADAVADQLLSQAGSRSVEEIIQAGATPKADPAVDPLVQSAQAVKQAVAAAGPVEKAANVIAQTAVEIAASAPRGREALAAASQEVLNPQQQGESAHVHNRNREYLRRALIKRMRPLDALDAQLFLAINHLPHNRWLNGFFYFPTFIFTGGAAWFGLLVLRFLFNHHEGRLLARRVVLPLALSSLMVEYPIKLFFHRRRPFIGIIQAIVIGRKPGTWSFPSGHSAAAFSGAWLLSGYFPGLRVLFFGLAGLVGFSRIYLGDHYPGDVISGALSGMLLAEGARRLQQVVLRQAPKIV